MTYLVANNLPAVEAGNRFRALVERPGILRMPGAHCGLAALQAKTAGFEALYLSGAAMSASMGLPDLGILTIEDVCFHIRQLARSAQLPVLVDGDTGFGEALNVMHMVRCFEEAGAGAVQIEDQILPKKCGHLNDKRLASPEDMAAKIAAAARARRHLYIVARTDAVASEGLDAAISRARRYVEAGADAIFPEALLDEESFKKFSDAVRVPLLANMTEFGRTPHMTATEFEKLGYKMIIWPVSSLRVAAKASERLYEELKQNGSVLGVLHEMLTREALYDVIKYHDYEDLDSNIVRSIAPAAPTGFPSNLR
jgi:methylisocitrate lyase